MTLEIYPNFLTLLLFLLRSRGQAKHTFIGRFCLGRMQFFARRVDWCAVEEVALEREYSFVRQMFRPEASLTVVDLGANIGMFSMYALSVWPSATVYSVEPSPRTYRLLERNRLANPGLHWHVYRYAVWKDDGETQFEEREYSTSSRIASAGVESTVVPTISLPTLMARHVRAPVDLMKMDIEGAEEVVLRESGTVLQEVANLVVEVHPQVCDSDRVIGMLRKNYRFLYRIPGRRSSKPLLVASQCRYAFPEYV